MKPSLTVDERGMLLHLVDDQGKGFAVPINLETAENLAAQLAIALERLRSPDTRGGFLFAVAKAVAREMLKQPKGKSSGTPDPEQR